MPEYRVVSRLLEEVYVQAESEEEARFIVENTRCLGEIYDSEIVAVEPQEET